MRETVNRKDLLKEMSDYKARQVMKRAVSLLLEDGFTYYAGQRKLEIPQEYIYRVLGRKIENG